MTEQLKAAQIRFPVDVYAGGRIQAGYEQVSFNALVVKALAAYVEQKKGERTHE